MWTNPTMVYSDQCYVWLKEMPDFFRERHHLADGLACDFTFDMPVKQ